MYLGASRSSSSAKILASASWPTLTLSLAARPRAHQREYSSCEDRSSFIASSYHFRGSLRLSLGEGKLGECVTSCFPVWAAAPEESPTARFDSRMWSGLAPRRAIGCFPRTKSCHRSTLTAAGGPPGVLCSGGGVFENPTPKPSPV